jgi:hypothetical protein
MKITARGLKRLARPLVLLAGFGAAAVTTAFFVVSQGDELADDRLRLSAEAAPPPEDFGPRYARWLRTVIGSGLTDFGRSHTGPVKNVLADRLPVTAVVALSSWGSGGPSGRPWRSGWRPAGGRMPPSTRSVSTRLRTRWWTPSRTGTWTSPGTRRWPTPATTCCATAGARRW